MSKRRRTPPHSSMTVERGKKLPQAEQRAYSIEEFRVAEFVPHNETEVHELHLLLKVKGFQHPIAARFRTPDTLGFLIEELIAYRQKIWPESQMPFPLDEVCLAEIDELLKSEETTLADVEDAPTI